MACLLFAQRADLLSSKYPYHTLADTIIAFEDWEPFPGIDDRSAWSQADQDRLRSFSMEAGKFLEYDWPYIPATASLAYLRTGDRDEYQQLSFEKRKVLGTMLLAEIYENEGRFIDQIVNGIWSICEESFWGVPAHLPRNVDGLADESDPIVDLFAAETATYLAWADYFLGEKLDSITPQIRKRIRNEANQRIFEPLMDKYHGWMGPNKNGRAPNNWNPWICSNWINSILLLEEDQEKRTAAVHKALQVLDEFLNPYPEDGGCDEGPSYWGAAAASLYDNISLLNLATNNAFAYVCEDPKFRNMGQFIYRAQISEEYFLNFADADPQPKMAAGMIYRYGKDIDDQAMMNFGAYYYQGGDVILPRFHYFRYFFELFISEEIEQTQGKLPLPGDVWLPDLEVMVARDVEGETSGFYLAAKGGHNDESHNHNDLGNYVVYYNGLPLIIDVGRGTYTRKTFSNQRYDIWYNNSNYHNAPSIGTYVQQPGPQYTADLVAYKPGEQNVTLSMDLSAAYPAEAGIDFWERTISLSRGEGVRIANYFQLDDTASVSEHFMTCYPPAVEQDGVVVIPFTDESGEKIPFKVMYNHQQMEPVIEKIPLTEKEDQGIISKWGDRIYRVTLKARNPVDEGTYSVRISR